MVVAAAAAVVAAVGVPDVTRDDEAITGAARAPMVTIMVADSQLVQTLPQSEESAYHRLYAPNEGLDALRAQIVAKTKLRIQSMKRTSMKIAMFSSVSSASIMPALTATAQRMPRSLGNWPWRLVSCLTSADVFMHL